MKKVKVGVLVASLFVSASCFAGDIYEVSTSVHVGGELVAAPIVFVEADKMATVSIGDDFSYDVTVSPKQDNTAQVLTAVTVGDDKVTPSFNVAYGESASMKVGAQKLTILVNKLDN